MNVLTEKPKTFAQAMREQDQKAYLTTLGNRMDNASEWSAALILCGLHDLFQFGRRRFAKMAHSWTERINAPGLEQGFALRWRNELENQCGLNRKQLELFAAKLEKRITNRTTDFRTKAKVRDMLAGMVITILYELYQNYGFRTRRIQRLQQKLMDMAYVISKGEVSIYEFMECLKSECDLTLETYRQWLETHDRPRIYG